jgi:hypothetical protein
MMSTSQLVEELKHLSNTERLEVIEAATRLVREDLGPNASSAPAERDRRMREAAARLKDLYELGGELTEWTALDSEDFTDEHVPR